MSNLEELLAKLGYSKYALESEIVTEDMLDEMYFQNTYCVTDTIFKDNNCNSHLQMMQADGQPFDINPTFVKTSN
uniref:Site-specific DNA-methyltransferase (adenine-specific) n=1 Tax=Caenorhabditis tropicalis TaxID=1561998 RepID=A0A1I7TZZ1_9PELO